MTAKEKRIYTPEKVFDTRSAAYEHMVHSADIAWRLHERLSEYFDVDWFVSSGNKALAVPRGKSEKLRPKAALYSNAQAIEHDVETVQEPFLPFVVGFSEFADCPERVPGLAEEFCRRFELDRSMPERKLLKALDRLVFDLRESGELDDLVRDDKFLSGICAVVGEIFRSKISDSIWIVKRDFNAVTKKYYHPADIAVGDEIKVEVSMPLAKQLSDPDLFGRKSIISNFVRSAGIIIET